MYEYARARCSHTAPTAGAAQADSEHSLCLLSSQVGVHAERSARRTLQASIRWFALANKLRAKQTRWVSARQLKLARTSIRTRVVTVDTKRGGRPASQPAGSSGRPRSRTERAGGALHPPSRRGSMASRGSMGAASRGPSRAASRAGIASRGGVPSRGGSRASVHFPADAAESAPPSRATTAGTLAAQRWETAPPAPPPAVALGSAPLTVTGVQKPAPFAPLEVKLPALPGLPSAGGGSGGDVAEMLAMPQYMQRAAHAAAAAEEAVLSGSTPRREVGASALSPPPASSVGAPKEVYSRAEMLEVRMAHSRQMHYLQECFQERLAALRDHYAARLQSAKVSQRLPKSKEGRAQTPGDGGGGGEELSGTLDGYQGWGTPTKGGSGARASRDSVQPPPAERRRQSKRSGGASGEQVQLSSAVFHPPTAGVVAGRRGGKSGA